jgi:hypothetical protein
MTDQPDAPSREPLTLLARERFMPREHGVVLQDGVRHLLKGATYHDDAFFVTALEPVAANTRGKFEEWIRRGRVVSGLNPRPVNIPRA